MVSFLAGDHAPVNGVVERTLRDTLDLLAADIAVLALPHDPALPEGEATVHWAQRRDGGVHYLRLPGIALTVTPGILTEGAERCGDAAGDPRLPDAVKALGVRAYLGLPVNATGAPHPFGVLYVARLRADHFGEAERRTARFVGQALAATLEQTVLAWTAAGIAGAADLEGALRALLVGVAALTCAELSGARLLADAERPLGPSRLYLWRGGDHYEWTEYPTLPGSATARVLQFGRSEYTVELLDAVAAGDPGAARAHRRDSTRSSLIVPLRVAGRVIGSLHADSRRPRAFSAAQLVPLQLLADQAAGAVERARLLAAERQAAEAAEGERQQKSLILARIGDAFFAMDRQWRITYLNPAAERGFRRLAGTPADFLGRPLWEALPALRDTPGYAHLQRAMAEQVIVTYERHYPALATWFDVHIYPDADGLSVYAQDVGGRKLSDADSDAERAARARAEGAVRTGRAVAHRLGSPLATVVGLATLVGDDPRLPPDLRDDARLMQAEALRAGDLLGRFARIARYEEEETPAGPQLDLGRASAPADRTP